MSDLDIARLARVLDLDTHLHPKLHNSPASPGVRRLDFDSGLFLLRGPEDGSWLLEGRAWGAHHGSSSTNGTCAPPPLPTSSTRP
jgi:hypothetical protein